MNDYFNSSGSDKELEIACQVALRDSLKVNPGERVLIITNPHEDIALISMGRFDKEADYRGYVSSRPQGKNYGRG